eukprot:10747087-Lingulodinium_polyedra.AAC.1
MKDRPQGSVKGHTPMVRFGVKGMYVPHADIESVPWGVEGVSANKIAIETMRAPPEECEQLAERIYESESKRL